jgi:integrase
MQTLTPEQAQKFLEAARDDPFEALYILAITTGMRQGELLGLKWQDIQLEQGKLQVRRSLARIGKQGFVTSEPKTKSSRRAIALATVAIEALKRHRIQQNERRLAAGPAWEDQDLVFCNLVGKPLEAGNLTRRSFRPLLEKAGAPKIRFHDLRHSAATLLLSMNVHPKIVQELLGHSSITITLDTYSHVLPSLQSEAVARFDTLLATAKNPVAVTVAVNGE